ncbi:MAG: hypothetical protein H7210_06500 [Pyrinomonadaceae bacterium]|nr:hypothetical protein [Phycisphaerales bacterium]
MRCYSRVALFLITVTVLSLSSISLTAQPEFGLVSPQDKKMEVTIPAGSYINFVFSLDMPSDSRPLRVSIDGIKGFSSFLVPPGETVILPVALGNTAMSIKRSLTVKLNYPAGRIYAFGTTATGPIPFKAD